VNYNNQKKEISARSEVYHEKWFGFKMCYEFPCGVSRYIQSLNYGVIKEAKNSDRVNSQKTVVLIELLLWSRQSSRT
jgi:hypothetical protein